MMKDTPDNDKVFGIGDIRQSKVGSRSQAKSMIGVMAREPAVLPHASLVCHCTQYTAGIVP